MAHLHPVLTADQMRKCDAYTIHTFGIPSQVLMERAARGAVACLASHHSLFFSQGNTVLVLCGGGNNGGDGFAVARFLKESRTEKPQDIVICYGGVLGKDGCPDESRMSEECAKQYRFVRQAGFTILSPEQAIQNLKTIHAVVDALFGIGLDRPITGPLATLINAINALQLPVLAVDIPSGIHGDTGEVMNTAIRATATVTMQALKPGLLLYPGAEYCGKIEVCDIGVTTAPAEPHTCFLADTALLQTVLPPRHRRSHKGTYGKLALVCGSQGMAGAAILAARGALKAGVGLACAVTPESNRNILQTAIPEAITACYDPLCSTDRAVLNQISSCDGAVIGCGLGQSQESVTLVSTLLNILPLRPDFPVILDADALNILSKHPHLWETPLLTHGRSQVIITPHPMEMARLTGISVKDILTSPIRHAQIFAAERGVTVVLKDAHTVIADPNGTVYICPFGNAGMAKGGSGDVLAGIIGALTVQNRHDSLSLATSAAAGVALHALAGDAAAESYGELSMTPSDIIAHINAVTKSLSNTRTVISHRIMS